ncbi:hypothetical protein EMCRGX_G023327 [Ephydatia muelleri]
MDALKNVSEAKELLIQLEREEAVLREELDLLLEQQSQMDVKMTSFQKMLPGLRNLDRDTQEMDAVVMKASSLAESHPVISVRICAIAVSVLSTESGVCIVEESDDVIDLKCYPTSSPVLLYLLPSVTLPPPQCYSTSSQCYPTSSPVLLYLLPVLPYLLSSHILYSPFPPPPQMNAPNVSGAAGHVHRYLALDESILLDTITDLMKGSSSSTVSVSFELRREAEARLKDLVRSKFNEASSCSDSSSLESFICGVGSKSCYALVCPFFGSALRFFKVFPLLNLHEEGLKLLNGHLSKLVREGAQKNLHVAAEAKAALPWKPPYVVT